MKKMYQEFLAGVDKDFLRENAIKLMTIEQKQTSAAHYKACEFVRDLMIENGIPNVELLEFPADGKTVYQDKRMPIAWDATVGKLTIIGKAPAWTPYWGDGAGGEGVLADYQRHPFHLIHGSVSTPPEGIITEIITEDHYLAGADPRGRLVMLNPMTDPRPRVLKPILDQGGLGVVSDYLVGRYSTPDHLQWVVACTETGDWHVTAQDRPFIGFSVSPKVGDMIRKSNGCKVKVECDGRRYEGVLPMVTALIPGKSEKEVWVMAHMFEPMLNDDAIGVITGIEVAKQLLKKGGTPDYSIRLVFAMEFYGFAAYAAYRGGNLNGKVVGACNLDSISCVTADMDLKLSPSGCDPSLCNVILKEMYEEFKDVRRLLYASKEYHDDQHLSDRSVGVPTTWLMGIKSGLWHNSRQCEPDFINWDLLHENAAFACVYFDRMANSAGVVVPEQKLELKELHSPWRDYAANFVFARKEPGFPNSQAKVPAYAKIPLPDGVIYGPFGNILSNMDGKKNVATLILEAEAERGFDLKEGQVKKVLNALNHLADYGYLDVIERPALTQEDLVAALKQAGITQDDVLLVHASISKCGYIQGGAETVINAIREASDTCLFTTFTRPYIYLGAVNSGWNYQPHDPAVPDQVWTGTIGKTVLRNYPDAIRSRHVTHSWAGFGSKAHACLDAHEPCDTPTGKNSPLEKALELNGKILFFGTGLEPSYEMTIHPTAYVHPTAKIAPNVHIGANAVVDERAEIGEGAIIRACAYIGQDCKIGEKTVIHPNVSIMHACVIGKRCIIHAGTTIGADGFGYTPSFKGLLKVPQNGIVQIDDDVEIGANSAVDRARFSKTWVKKGVKIDNLVQVGHNVIVGESSALIGQCGIAGSAVIGRGCSIGGQAGINGHIELADGTQVIGPSAVQKNTKPGESLLGFPAEGEREFLERHMIPRKVRRLTDKVKELEELVKKLQEQLNSKEG